MNQKQKVFCIECQKYFGSVEDWNKEHDKVSYKIMKLTHNPLIDGNILAYISNILSDNIKIKEIINKQNIEINQIKNKLNFYEDALKNNVFFETNINIKNAEIEKNGKCLLHFFPKSIHFRIEYKGKINFTGRKEFEIEILFPFKISELKYSSIEKLQGCLSSHKVQNLSEQETTIFNNYSSSINQKNNLISIKLLRNYYSIGYLEQKKIDISINGILTFSNFEYNINLPSILYNIDQKRFICYENYHWKFIDNCFLDDGSINNNCIINFELNNEFGDIYIKNQYKYLGNSPDFVTNDKNNAKFQFLFFNKFYGIISFLYNNQYLSSDIETGFIKLSNEKNFFIIYNI